MKTIKYQIFFFISAMILISFTSCNDTKTNDSPKQTNKITEDQVDTTSETSETLTDSLQPKKITFRLIRTFKHDKEAFTQGLLYSGGFLYESTGLNGKSSIRKINYKTGEIVKDVKFQYEYFCEGLELVNDKFYLLTYKSGLCLTFDKNLKINEELFEYSGEGWGLTYDGEYLIKSNGTNILEFISIYGFFINKKLNLKDEYGNPLFYVNEMEYINGKIWANIWGSGSIVIINPTTGIVEQRFDFSDLIEKQNNKVTADVLNGIAYIKENNSIILTGKNWDTFFEYKIIEE
jgi:glutamine cyclotransferase